MPEGDSIFKAAAMLRPILVGQRVTGARARLPGPAVERLVGSTVNGVETHGKHIVLSFDNGLALHVHLGMQGRWRVFPAGESVCSPSIRLLLDVPNARVACLRAPTIELLPARVLAIHPALSSLGPDPLKETFDPREALARLRGPAQAERPIAAALLDQRLLAGLGNVYKCELLFLERLHPATLVGDLDDGALLRLIERGRRLLRANRATTVRRTAGGGSDGGPRHWVYRRAGLPCSRCRAPIAIMRPGPDSRTTYWCPHCQTQPSSSAGGFQPIDVTGEGEHE